MVSTLTHLYQSHLNIIFINKLVKIITITISIIIVNNNNNNNNKIIIIITVSIINIIMYWLKL